MAQTPNFDPNKQINAKLSTDRYTFQKHIDGEDFFQEGTSVTLIPAINIGGNDTDDVREAILALNAIVGPATIQDATAIQKGVIRLNNDLSGTAQDPTVKGIRGTPISNFAQGDLNIGDALIWDGYIWDHQAVSGSFTAAGDVGGTSSYQQVTGLQTFSIATTTPTSGQSLVYSGSEWSPSTLTVGNTFTAAGDLGGNENSQTVLQIRGNAVALATPTAGQVMTWSGSSEWTPTTPVTGNTFTAAGDLSGTESSQVVIQMQGEPISASTPTNGQALVYDGASWSPATLSTGAFTAGADLSGTDSEQTLIAISGYDGNGDGYNQVDVSVTNIVFDGYQDEINFDGYWSASLNGAPMTIRAQMGAYYEDGLGYGAGGDLNLLSGSGTTKGQIAGVVNIGIGQFESNYGGLHYSINGLSVVKVSQGPGFSSGAMVVLNNDANAIDEGTFSSNKIRHALLLSGTSILDKATAAEIPSTHGALFYQGSKLSLATNTDSGSIYRLGQYKYAETTHSFGAVSDGNNVAVAYSTLGFPDPSAYANGLFEVFLLNISPSSAAVSSANNTSSNYYFRFLVSGTYNNVRVVVRYYEYALN